MPARSAVVLRQACSVVIAALLVGGCANTDATSAVNPTTAALPTGGGAQQTVSAGPSPSPAQSTGNARPAAKPAGGAIPSGAKYTIFCVAFNGGGHVQQATTSKDNLIRGTGRRDFYVVHEESQSSIYYGYYREYQRSVDPKEAARADADLAYLKSLGDAEGHQLFARSLFIPLPAAEPDAPAEYDLARLDGGKERDDPTRRYWSIAIAVYTADATPTGVDAGKNRKQLAVESVLEARRQGVEAYYFNGKTVSMVCIGAWPREAIRSQMTDQDIKRFDNGDEIIASNFPLPQQLMDDIEHSGKHVNVVQPKLEIEDPALLATWKQYRDFEVNGKLDISKVTDPNTGESKQKVKHSFLVEIPEAQPSNLLTDRRNTQAAQPDAAPESNPLLPGQSFGGGRLKSVSP